MKSLSAIVAALLLFSVGCAQYRLGSMLPKDIKTVYIPTCRNQTSEPLIEQDVTRAVLAQVQMDGSLRVAGESDSDVVLEITIKRFWLDPVSYEAGSASTANQYRMNLNASFVLYRRGTHAVVVESPTVTGWHDFDFTGDMSSSKAIALLPAAEDLGRRIVSQIVQYWP